MFKLILISGLVALSTSALIGGGLMGGWRNADANDENVQKVVSFAETTLNSRTNSMFASKVSNVLSVKTQLVNGLNYQIEFEFSQTDCRKGAETMDLSACQEKGKVDICDVRVWTSFDASNMQLGDFNCGPSKQARSLRLGGPKKVPVEELANYKDTVIKAFSMANADLEDMKLVSVETQTVAGQKIMMKLVGKQKGKPTSCEVDVWTQPWLGDAGFRVTKFQCGKSVEKRAGGVSKVPASQMSEYMETATRAMSMMNAGLKNMKLVSVKTQLVAGQKIMMTLTGEQGDKPTTCEVDVWSQSWINVFKVTKFSCSKTSDKRAILGGVTGGITDELGDNSVYLFTAKKAFNMTHPKLQVLEVLSARTQVVAGQNIFLTVRAMESDVEKVCDIQIWKRDWLKGSEAFKVTDVSCKNSKDKRQLMGRACAGCVSEDKNPMKDEYMSAYLGAFRAAGSNLDVNNIKILSVKTQVVAGIRYMMKVQTSEGGEPRICDVDFVVAPWKKQSTNVLKFDCKAM